MRILTDSHPTEKVLKEIEAVLLKNNTRIYYDGYQTIVEHNGVKTSLINKESGDKLHSLPREIDGDVLTIVE